MTDNKYDEIKKQIITDINNPEIYEIFGNQFDIIDKTIKNIFADIDSSINNTFTKSDLDEHTVLTVLDFLEKLIILKALSINAKQLIDCIIQCIFNWNRNILNSESVVYRLTVIDRSLKSIFSMAETINILKSLVDFIKIQTDEANDLTSGLSLKYIELLDLGK